MKLVLIGIGRMKAGPERELLTRYLGRAEASARAAGLGAVTLIEIDESRARTPEQRKREEKAAVADRLPARAELILLDEGGAPWSSEDFATEIGRLRDRGVASLAFAIGGADGWDPEFRASHRRVAFGAATFPHQLVRVLLAEQMYRAITILTGHPYHRV